MLISTVTLLQVAAPALADTAGRPDDGTPDEVYLDVQGPSYLEKDGAGNGPMRMAGPLAPVNFPYSYANWSITSWFSTGDGLRFYLVSYKGEEILYDYRVPWVQVNGVRHALSTQQLVQGPDLNVYYSGMFLVKARYNLGNPNIDVTVITRFYNDGTIEPWVLVDGHSVNYNIAVGQRFDFDLGGSDDDNQQYYNGNAWKYTALESSSQDASYGENASGYQWRDFDTDQVGNGYIFDQEVDITPYHADASTWYCLAYTGGELNSDPAIYENNQAINVNNPAWTDPWFGYDAVNWYVSAYTMSSLVYPGPWVHTFV